MEDQRQRRKVTPVSRLTYTGLGQQGEKQLPTTSTAPRSRPTMGKQDKFQCLTDGILKTLISTAEDLKKTHYEVIKKCQDQLDWFRLPEGRLPSLSKMSHDEGADLEQTKQELAVAIMGFKRHDEDAREYREELVRRQRQLPEVAIGKGNECRSNRGTSITSQASKLVQVALLEHQEEEQNLRHQYENNEDEASQYKAELLLELETAVDARKEELQTKVDKLERQMAACKKKYETKTRQLKEQFALKEKRIQIENEEEADLENDYENRISVQKVQDWNEWGDHGGTGAFSMHDYEFYGQDYGRDKGPENRYDDQYVAGRQTAEVHGLSPSPPPPVYVPSVKGQPQPPSLHVGITPQQQYDRGRFQQHPINYGIPPPAIHPLSLPPLPPPAAQDKDMLLVQLMQNQLTFMQKSQGSFGDKKLPDFGGDPSDWGNFKATFERTNRKYGFELGENLARLQTALKGEAKETVKHLMNSINNVPEIMRILERRFGRPEYVLDYLTEKVRTTKAPDTRYPKTIVDFGIAVQSLVANVASYNRQDYMYNRSLVMELVAKLPGSLKGAWFEWLEEDEDRQTNLVSFSEWLDKKSRVAERQLIPSVSEGKVEEKSRAKRGSAVNTVTADKEETKTKDPCGYCEKSGHPIEKCFSFKKLKLDEKDSAVKDRGLCFRCLNGGHTRLNCKSDVTCDIKGCKGQHHPLLHSDKVRNKRIPDRPSGKSEKNTHSPEEDKVNSTSEPEKEVSTTMGSCSGKSSKPLSVVRVRIQGPKGTKKIFALLDSGANVTAISADLAKELGITGPEIQHECKGIGGAIVKEKAQSVTFKIAGAYGGAKFFEVKKVVTMSKLGLAPYTQDAVEAKRKWPYLRKARLESFQGAVPQIIVGEDHPHLGAHRRILERDYDDPMAKRTVLGWVLAGRKVGKDSTSSINLCQCSTEELEKLMKMHFSLEAFGVETIQTPGSVEDVKALGILEDNAKQLNGKWECGLLWRYDNTALPDSNQQAMQRLISNERRMKKDPVYFDMYHDKMNEYIQKGYIRELTQAEIGHVTQKTNYLPHFGVYNVNKPGKLRLVFDAAAVNEGKSLNEFLLTGPDLIRPITSVLMNFRRHNFVINGDIADMFHRVGMIKKDQDSQRFLFRNLRENIGIKTYVMTVLIFGARCSPCTAIFIKNKNAQQYEEKFPEAARAIRDDFYSDDCLTGAQTVDETIQLRKDISMINAAGNFYIKKWLSNNKKILESIPDEDRAEGAKKFAMKTDIPVERILGLYWNPQKDEFTFTTNFKKVDRSLLEGRKPTKREVSRLVMSVFDPLGFVGNFKIKGIMIMQQIWRTGTDWDEDITEPVYEDWKLWLEHLKKIPNIAVPRMYCYDIHLASSVQLHTYSDASEEGCVCSSYLRIKMGSTVTVSFVCSKTRVAPTKKQTIPRLELLAAELGAMNAGTIVDELKVKIDSKFYWTDSRTVLLWIRSETLRYREFVANRISRIHQHSNVKDWYWVPTALNVADDGTRLHAPLELSSSSLWLSGPLYLQKDPEAWPKENKNVQIADVEEIKSKINVSSSYVIGEVTYPSVDVDRYSSFNRMCRVQSAVIKAVQHWIKKWKKIKIVVPPWCLPAGTKIPKRASEDHNKYMWKVSKFLRHNLRSSINCDDLAQAELSLIMKVQEDSFPEDIIALRQGKSTKKGKLWRLSPYLDHSIIRMRGRISAAQVSDASKNPIILPSKHPFTELLILREHKLMAHQGLDTVLNNLRAKYWILEGRAAVRRGFKHCLECKQGKAKPIVPEMGNLPHYRLAGKQHPFSFTGVDLFRPMEVVVGRHHEKRWGCLFTCMVTRAVHLEVVYGLSTDEFMMALSRFIDQRGRPLHVYSDNGTNFVGGNKELKKNWELVNWEKVTSCERFHPIKWNFMPPYSPHFGGCWERMVQAVKKVLKKTLHEKYPKDQVLLTVLKGAENIVNSRPLTYVSGDSADPEALSPNHFVRGFSDMGPSIPGEYGDADEYLRVQWRRAQMLLDLFWSRWVKEVLPEMAKRQKWTAQAEPLEIGEVVLLVDDNQPRNTWVKALVTAVFPGSDGQVRVAEVTTADFKTKKRSTYRRGVDKIVPLGVKMENQDQ